MSGSDPDPTRIEPPASGPGSRPKGAGGGGGGSGGGGADPCAIVQDAPLNSPNPAVVSGLSVGDQLLVSIGGAASRPILELTTATGTVAGSLTHVGHLQIIRCIEDGNRYRAEVIHRSGGSVVVRVERA